MGKTARVKNGALGGRIIERRGRGYPAYYDYSPELVRALEADGYEIHYDTADPVSADMRGHRAPGEDAGVIPFDGATPYSTIEDEPTSAILDAADAAGL